MRNTLFFRRTRTAMKLAAALSLALAATVAALPAAAGRDGRMYEVTITNVTYGQQFTPVLVVTHEPSLKLYTLGAAASAELTTLAEEGNVGPLKAMLDADPKVNATVAGSGLTNPGQSVVLQIRGHQSQDRLSLAAMLIPTNDAFVGLDGVALPKDVGDAIAAIAYDAGSEVNNETCASIPGPSFVECGGPGGGSAAGGGEGFVHVHRGIHGVGAFDPATRAWQNPVAIVSIRRVN